MVAIRPELDRDPVGLGFQPDHRRISARLRSESYTISTVTHLGFAVESRPDSDLNRGRIPAAIGPDSSRDPVGHRVRPNCGRILARLRSKSDRFAGANGRVAGARNLAGLQSEFGRIAATIGAAIIAAIPVDFDRNPPAPAPLEFRG